MSDDKSAVDQAMELFVFAPIGLALAAQEALPELIERGRERVTGQAAMARMVGQFAVQEGQARAGKLIGEVREGAIGVFEQFVEDGSHATSARTNGSSAPAAATVTPEPAPARQPVAPKAPVTPGAPRRPGPSAAELAIPDYDSLAASQVVPRLSGLAPDELDAVQRYEEANRARKTILARVSQLQSGR